MSKNKDLAYRAVCPKCGKAYDIRNGRKLNGILLCADCHGTLPFRTLDNIIIRP